MNMPPNRPNNPQAQQQGSRGFLASSAADSAGQFSTTVSQEGGEALATFLSKLYGWLLGGIGVAGGTAALLVMTGMAESLMQLGTWGFLIVILVALFGTRYWAHSSRHSYPMSAVSYAAFAAALGLLATPGIYYAQAANMPEVVTQAFGLTVAMFTGLSYWGATSDTDFSFLRGFAYAGALVLLGAIVLTFFFNVGSMLHMAISAGGVLLFAVFTLFQTQQIINHYPRDEYIAGAITLLFDFVGIFIFLLNLLMMGER